MKIPAIFAVAASGVVLWGIASNLAFPPIPYQNMEARPPEKSILNGNTPVLTLETAQGRPPMLSDSPEGSRVREVHEAQKWKERTPGGQAPGKPSGMKRHAPAAETSKARPEPELAKTATAGSPDFENASGSGGRMAAEVDFPKLAVPFSLQEPGQAATIPAALALMPVEGAEAPDPLEQQGIDKLATAFLDGVEPHIDPDHSLPYQQAWKTAQEQADMAMKAQYGGQAWLLRHAAVHRQAISNGLDSAMEPEPAQ